MAWRYESIRVGGTATIDVLEHSRSQGATEVQVHSALRSGAKRYELLHQQPLPGGAFLLEWMVSRFLAGDSQARMPGSRAANLGVFLSYERAAVPWTRVRLNPVDIDGNQPARYYMQPQGFLAPSAIPPAQHHAKRLEAPPLFFRKTLYLIDDALPSPWRSLLRDKTLRGKGKVDQSRQATNSLVLVRQRSPWSTGDIRELSDCGVELLPIYRIDDLRFHFGVRAPEGLSWEDAAINIVSQVITNPHLSSFQSLERFVILIGIEGALCFQRTPLRNSDSNRCGPDAALSDWFVTLSYDPFLLEGQKQRECKGAMIGLTTCFMARLGVHVAEHGLEHLHSGVRVGLQAAMDLQIRGLTKHDGKPSEPTVFDYEVGAATTGIDPEEAATSTGFFQCTVPVDIVRGDDSQQGQWSILEQMAGDTAIQAATVIVRSGPTKTALRQLQCPVGAFGDLMTVDRQEIESLGAVRNLIHEYASRVDARPPKPLSIAVFGPPGSGKGFMVSQIVRAVGRLPGMRIGEPHTINLSQIHSVSDLLISFRQVRDLSLSGVIPLALFDEFDTELAATPLGWLKYFLAPMQDGKYYDASGEHPFGKSIFVFAGGLARTHQDFVGGLGDARYFRDAKGPDFASRLRGHINVQGPNPPESSRSRQHGPIDSIGTIVRRAMMLRHLLAREVPTPSMHLGNGHELDVDAGVVRAFVTTPRYHHGARSIGAICTASRILGKRRFEPAALPAVEQIEMHTDATEFLRIAKGQAVFGWDEDGAAAWTALANAVLEVQDTLREDRANHPAAYENSGAAHALPFTAEEEVILVPPKGKAMRGPFVADIVRRFVQRLPQSLERMGCNLRRVPPGQHVSFPNFRLRDWDELVRGHESPGLVDALWISFISALARAGYEICRQVTFDSVWEEIAVRAIVATADPLHPCLSDMLGWSRCDGTQGPDEQATFAASVRTRMRLLRSLGIKTRFLANEIDGARGDGEPSSLFQSGLSGQSFDELCILFYLSRLVQAWCDKAWDPDAHGQLRDGSPMHAPRFASDSSDHREVGPWPRLANNFRPSTDRWKYLPFQFEVLPHAVQQDIRRSVSEFLGLMRDADLWAEG